ncbi:MAG: hypothetical protein HQK53_02925 [Oligoflexia bacterium]|nr:hypothetical protein [Oligoflexia bacterium]
MILRLILIIGIFFIMHNDIIFAGADIETKEKKYKIEINIDMNDLVKSQKLFDELISTNSQDYSKYIKLVSELSKAKIAYANESFLLGIINRIPAKVVSNELEKLLNSFLFKKGTRYLQKSFADKMEKNNSNVARYLSARNYFIQGKIEAAINSIRLVSEEYSVKALAVNLEASALSLLERYDEAIERYGECLSTNKRFLQQLSNDEFFHQERTTLEINQELCLLGMARTFYAVGEYDKAYFIYMSISKNSYLWPTAVFEEAWNSYKLEDINRTLGKLAILSLPILEKRINSEAAVLKVNSYIKFCMWEEVKSSINRYRNQYSNYLQLLRKWSNQRKSQDETVGVLLNGIVSKPAWNILNRSLKEAEYELSQIQGSDLKSNYKNVLIANINNFIKNQKKIAENYLEITVENKISETEYVLVTLNHLYTSKHVNQVSSGGVETRENSGENKGENMSLVLRKDEYRWNFNGELWGDELGDYVYKIRSNCH